MRQPFTSAVVRKPVTIKARDSVSRAKPEEPVRVSNNFVDLVIGQTVGGCVDLDWESLTVGYRREDQEQQ